MVDRSLGLTPQSSGRDRVQRGVPAGAVVPSHKRTMQAVRQGIVKQNTPGAATQQYMKRMADSKVVRVAPRVYSPLFEMTNLMLPRDMKTLNAWCRHHYDTNPIVRNCIMLHSTYPVSKLQIHCKDPKVKQFFEDMWDDIDGTEVIAGIALEYFKLGEVFAHAELDEERGVWSQIIIHNPDYISVKANILAKDPIISLQPDDTLRRMIFSTRMQDVRLREQVPEEIIYYIQRGENIPLSNFNVSHLKLLSSPYDIRGTSIITCVFKDLMLYDKLREMEFAQADNLVNPITLVKLGDPQGGWRPTDADIQSFQRVMEEAQYDPDFRIITHGAVTIERVGAAGTVIDTVPKLELIYKNLFAGLFTPESIIYQEGPTYASASVGLEVLQQRYLWFREFIRKFIRKKLFGPISIIQGFYETKEGEKRLIVPDVQFDRINLKDVADYINNLAQFAGLQGPVSNKSMLRSLDLDIDEEFAEKRKDIIQAAILEKEVQALASYSIEELRSLDPTKSIKTKPGRDIPGEVGELGEGGVGELGPGTSEGMPELPVPGAEAGEAVAASELSAGEMGAPGV